MIETARRLRSAGALRGHAAISTASVELVIGVGGSDFTIIRLCAAV